MTPWVENSSAVQEEWASTSTQVRRRQSPRAPWLLALSEGSLLLGKVDNLLGLLGFCILGSRNQLGRLEKVGKGWRGWEKVGEGGDMLAMSENTILERRHCPAN